MDLTYGFMQMLARIPLGIVTDAASCYKKTILMGTLFTTLSSFGLIFSTHFVTILICRVLARIAASSWLAFTILYSAYYEADKSVQAMTSVNAFSSAGKLLAFFLGTAAATIWGYRIPRVCSFLTGVIAVICAWNLKPIAIRREPCFPSPHQWHGNWARLLFPSAQLLWFLPWFSCFLPG